MNLVTSRGSIKNDTPSPRGFDLEIHAFLAITLTPNILTSTTSVQHRQF